MRDGTLPRPVEVIDWQWIASRTERIFGVDDAMLCRRRAFFCDLDLHCNLLLLPFNVCLGPRERHRRHCHVATAVDHLARRLRRRLHRDSTPSVESIPVTPAVRESVDALSCLQLGLLRLHFGNGRGGLDLDAVRSAFESFSNGDLRLGADGRHPGRGGADGYATLDCEPSGDFYFHFGEFAFAAIDLGTDVAEWISLAPILVSTQEIFARAYQPPPGRLRFGGYSSTHFDDNFDRRPGPTAIAELRVRHAALTLAELDERASENVRDAYRDEPVADPGSGH